MRARRVRLEHRRLPHVDARGHLDRLAFLQHDAFGPVGAHQADHRVTDREGGDVVAQRDDAAGALDAGPRRQLGRPGIAARDGQKIGRVDRAGGDLDDQFVGAGRSARVDVDAAADFVWRAEAPKFDDFHAHDPMLAQDGSGRPAVRPAPRRPVGARAPASSITTTRATRRSLQWCAWLWRGGPTAVIERRPA